MHVSYFVMNCERFFFFGRIIISFNFSKNTKDL
jgi:hypothetical protein